MRDYFQRLRKEFQKRNYLVLRILEAYITNELQPWVKTFPEDFYRQMFRLRGLDYPKATINRPQYFGHLTNDVVYDRLAPGVREELKKQTPRDAKGRHSTQLHRRLTTDLGHPKLREHMAAVVALMTISNSWEQFIDHLDQARPRWDKGVPLLGRSPEDNWGL